jgi:hypothetical protein
VDKGYDGSYTEHKIKPEGYVKKNSNYSDGNGGVGSPSDLLSRTTADLTEGYDFCINIFLFLESFDYLGCYIILFLIFLGYFMLREFGGNPEQVSRYAAVVGILAFLDVPLIFLSVKFWLPEMQSHPQVGQYFDSANPLPTYLLIFSFLSLLVVSSLMIRLRTNILSMKEAN